MLFLKDETNWYHCENTELSTNKLLDYLSIRAEKDKHNLKVDKELGTCVIPSNPQVI